MDFALMIKHRLEELGLEQRDLAHAAEVTESYVSQLLTRKKAPPAPGRTDIYEKMSSFLKLPNGELAKLAESEQQAELRRKLADSPAPLLAGVREIVLRKCKPNRRKATDSARAADRINQPAADRTTSAMCRGMCRR